MTRTDSSNPLLAQLQAALDVHGARPERWPDAMRAKLSAFVERDREAARLFAQARALDGLLALPPEPAAPHGLEARILASAAALPQQPGRVAAFPVARNAGRMWPELALLAASLFIGIVIGASGEALPTLRDVAVIAGLFDPGGLPGPEAL
jgi:hypothetical protein